MAVKGIGLLSGGLDSTLATRIMIEMGVEVQVVNFMSPFCQCSGKESGCKSAAVEISKEWQIPIRRQYLGDEYMEIVRNPKFGYGKQMNPCVDCRVMMFSRAKQVMIDEKADFIFTGEVLGQRPMSQVRHRMELIEQESGLEGYILRPLCAKLMKPTVAEQKGLIDRGKLLSISGRSRKEQLRLANEYELQGHLCSSGGGCLLTEKSFVPRIKDLLDHKEKPTVHDTYLLRWGRHFRVSEGCKVIVGRDERENAVLERMVNKENHIFRAVEHTGPSVLALGELDEDLVQTISRITARYSDAPPDASVLVEYFKKGEDKRYCTSTRPIQEEELATLRM